MTVLPGTACIIPIAGGAWQMRREDRNKNNGASRIAEKNTPPTPCLFTGKLVCADCKAPLVANREKHRRKNGTVKTYTSYYCSRHANSGRSSCSRHTIFEGTLTELLLGEIRAQAQALELDEAAVVDKLQKQLISVDARRREDARKEMTRLRRRIDELEHMTAKLYEDKVCGTVSEATFRTLMQKGEQERLEKAERLEVLLAEAKRYEQQTENIKSWAATVRKHLHTQELDRMTVDELIDHIEVGERAVIDGRKYRDIKIFYRFVGQI